MSEEPIARLLGRAAVASRRHELPAAARGAALRVLVDWCAVTVGGAATAPARLLRVALAGSEGPASLVGAGGGADPALAALVNGTAAHALELDDIYSPGMYHPGAPTIAAALAVGQRERVDGARLLRAVVVGYEVGNRVAETLGPSHYARWHTTGTAGSVAAAAAVAEVLGLDTERFAHALGLAGTMAAGLQQTFRSDSMGKPLHSGHAAQNGVVAGLAAAQGVTGPLDVFDGEIGMGVVMSDGPQWADIGGDFGPDHLVELTTVKPYPCCGHTFAAIDAALAIRTRLGDSTDVDRIDVHTYRSAVDVAGILAPVTPYEGKFSLPYVVAGALLSGRVGLDLFDDATLRDPELRDLMGRVRLHADDELTAAFPHRRGARVAVVRRSGEIVEAAVPDRRGDPANPVTTPQLWDKFADLVGGVLGADRTGRLERQLRDLEQLDDVRRLELGTG